MKERQVIDRAKGDGHGAKSYDSKKAWPQQYYICIYWRPKMTTITKYLGMHSLYECVLLLKSLTEQLKGYSYEMDNFLLLDLIDVL